MPSALSNSLKKAAAILPELPAAERTIWLAAPVLSAIAQGAQADPEIGAGIAVSHGKDIDPIEQIGPAIEAGIPFGKPRIQAGHEENRRVMAMRSYLPFSLIGNRSITLMARGRA